MTEAKRDTVGVVGLGSMGMGMATTLAGKGFRVLGFDLIAERRSLAAASGVEAVDTTDKAFVGAKYVLFSLPTAKDVTGVVEANAALLGSWGVGRVIVVDTSTSEPDVSRALAAKLAEAGHGFLDAPVSGGPNGAATGTMAMLIGGTDEDFAMARPVIEAMASKILHVGPSSEQARRRLRVGIIWVNCVHTLSAGTPVSGHKASGMGIEYGLEAVEQYMRVKTTVTMHGGWRSPFA